MNLFELKRNYEFNLPLTASIDLINLKFTKLLNLFNFTTGHESDIILFKRKLLVKKGPGYDILNVFREGNVRIFTENNKLKISWTVKLDNLYYLAFLIDIVLVIFSWCFFNIHFFYLVIISIGGFVFSSFFGKTEIISKILEVNASCIEE
jgi:hypothetical protein